MRADADPIGEMVATGDLYLELLKKCLTDTLRPRSRHLERVKTSGRGTPRRQIDNLAIKTIERLGYSASREVDWERRKVGKDWPADAETMIGIERLNHLQFCVEDTIANHIPGDLIETGVWRGGASIFMRAVLHVHQVTDKQVWLADSFQGLPRSDPSKYPLDKRYHFEAYQQLAVDIESVKENFRRFGLLDEQVRFLPGWFKDTLPGAPIERLSILRLDGDLYESTMDGLTSLYEKLSVGGYLIIDDYGAVEACREAVSDFRDSNGITDQLETIDWTGAFWKKT